MRSLICTYSRINATEATEVTEPILRLLSRLCGTQPIQLSQNACRKEVTRIANENFKSLTVPDRLIAVELIFTYVLNHCGGFVPPELKMFLDENFLNFCGALGKLILFHNDKAAYDKRLQAARLMQGQELSRSTQVLAGSILAKKEAKRGPSITPFTQNAFNKNSSFIASPDRPQFELMRPLPWRSVCDKG